MMKRKSVLIRIIWNIAPSPSNNKEDHGT